MAGRSVTFAYRPAPIMPTPPTPVRRASMVNAVGAISSSTDRPYVSWTASAPVPELSDA